LDGGWREPLEHHGLSLEQTLKISLAGGEYLEADAAVAQLSRSVLQRPRDWRAGLHSWAAPRRHRRTHTDGKDNGPDETDRYPFDLHRFLNPNDATRIVGYNASTSSHMVAV